MPLCSISMISPTLGWRQTLSFQYWKAGLVHFFINNGLASTHDASTFTGESQLRKNWFAISL